MTLVGSRAERVRMSVEYGTAVPERGSQKQGEGLGRKQSHP